MVHNSAGVELGGQSHGCLRRFHPGIQISGCIVASPGMKRDSCHTQPKVGEDFLQLAQPGLREVARRELAAGVEFHRVDPQIGGCLEGLFRRQSQTGQFDSDFDLRHAVFLPIVTA